jgi:hypothetical protein
VRENPSPPIPTPPITSDPPDHRPAKQLLLPAFTPDAVARYEPETRAICHELIGRLSGKTRCDGAVDYAQEIPGRDCPDAWHFVERGSTIPSVDL